MAYTKEASAKKLRLSTTYMVDGKNMRRSKTFANVNPLASDNICGKTGAALASLLADELAEMRVIEEATLVETP